MERERKTDMRSFLVHAVITLVLLSILLITGAFFFIYFGIYNVAATEQHTRPVYWLLDMALKQSIRRRAEKITVPPLTDTSLINRGFHCYQEQCLQCHGAPGVARDDLGKGLTPVPVELVYTAREWTPAEIYWTVRHGIKMTGMPAWEFRLPDEDLWAIVAFVKQLHTFSPQAYEILSQELGVEPCQHDE